LQQRHSPSLIITSSRNRLHAFANAIVDCAELVTWCVFACASSYSSLSSRRPPVEVDELMSLALAWDGIYSYGKDRQCT